METFSPTTRPRFDARALFAVATAVVIASVSTVRGTRAMLVLFLFACVAHSLVSGRISTTARLVARIAPFAALIVVLNALLVPGDAWLSVAGRRVVSREGFASGVFFALRLGAMLTVVSAFVAGSTAERLARAAYDAVRRISARAAEHVALFVFLTVGFVPLFADEFNRIRVAQAFRGGAFTGGLGRRAAAARSWLIPLILSALHRSDQLALAVELRDVRRRLPHTIEPPRAGARDFLLVAAATIVVVAASVID
jgi:energy-coupling factor transporter transmembrane protein EcfT